MGKDNFTDQVGTLEKEKDAGKGPEGVHKFWMMELDAADKLEEDWRDDSDDIEEQYRAEGIFDRSGTDADEGGLVSHNILYSNVETMRPAIYDSAPKPDIRRRFRDQDIPGRQAAKTLERAVSHEIDVNDLDHVMNSCVLDYLLPGRAVARIRYRPDFKTIPEQSITVQDNEKFIITPEREILDGERAIVDYIPWRLFRMAPARSWKDVRWVCFDAFITRAQAEKKFGAVGGKIPLDTQTKESHRKDDDFDKVPSNFKRAYIREVWDKKTKRVIWIAPSWKKGPLRIDADPLGLVGFFPTPRPMYAIETSSNMIPVPEYFQYKNQAEELDIITRRIRGLIKALRLRGVYDSTLTEMEDIQNLRDNEYIPLTNALQFKDSGGLEKAIYTMPIAEAAKVLAQLYQQRDQIKETIFEITGLSDIMRGVSKASETATAQNIKSQFGSLRVNRRQREVQRFARDIIRMMTEIIAEHFQPQTIQEMTQQPLNPEVFRLMKSDQLRSYRIDVETDSTIAKQLLDDEESYAKLLAAIAQFVQGIAPMVAQGFIPLKVAMSLLQGGIRRFKLGRPVEEAFDEIDIEAAQKQQQEQQQQQGDPDAQAKAQELQLKTQEMEAQLRLAAQKLQLDAKGQEGKAQVDAAKLQLEREKATAQIQLEREKASATLNLERDKAVSGAESTERKNSSDLELRRELELGIPKEDFMAEIESKLTQVLQVFAQASTQQHSQLAEAIGKMSEAVEELAKPKKLIRDKSGKAIGAKTVDKI